MNRLKMTIGIPRGLLFYRYGEEWKSFFTQLGHDVILSDLTTQGTLDAGSAVAVDETCLSLKVFFGHVQSLIGRCDCILIPRMSNLGRNRELCPRFEALYDHTRNAFRQSGQRFLTYNVDIKDGKSEEAAFVTLGLSLGASRGESRKAYDLAKKEAERLWKGQVKRQSALLEKEGMKVLIAAHSYVMEDPYMGGPITTYLKQHQVIPLRADLVDRESALKKSNELSPTCKWEMSRELLGGIQLYRKKVDGLILVSTFPCGSDAMVNDLLMRRLSGLPILNLVLDGQSGTAGLETRLESFLDIIQYQRGAVS